MKLPLPPLILNHTTYALSKRSKKSKNQAPTLNMLSASELLPLTSSRSLGIGSGIRSNLVGNVVETLRPSG